MSLAQENFDRAVASGYGTLRMLTHGTVRDNDPTPPLKDMHINKLRTIVWDLEAIQAAIRLELMERENQQPVDFG